MKNHIMTMDKAVSKINDARIETLEGELLKHDQVDCPVTHRFGPGTYIREVLLPAGAIVIGHRQNFEHTNVVLKGRLALLNSDGSTTEYKAPMIFTGKPGRKVAYVFEETTWLNVYPNTDGEQDVDKLEGKWLTKSEAFSLAKEGREALLLAARSVDEKDFEKALLDLGSGKDTAWVQSDEKDLAYLPDGAYKFKISPSRIHGKGIFAVGEYAPNEIIGPARLGDKLTVLGRYTNHGANPNARFIIAADGDVHLMALDKIFGCRGGFDGDEITIDYRDIAKLTEQLTGESPWQE